MRSARLDTNEHTICGFIEIDEDHAAVFERVVGHLLEPAVEIAIREPRREDLDPCRAARTGEAAEQLLGATALAEVGQVHGRDAVVDEQPAKARQVPRQRCEIGILERLA